MSLDPKSIHALEQLSALIREVGREVAAYRRTLIAEGMPEDEAWALVQRLEERLLGPFMEDIDDLKDEPPGSG